MGCLNCGGELKRNAKKYCSNKCYVEFKKKTKTCVDEIDFSRIDVAILRGGDFVVCPICGWEGKHLGVHLPNAHGVSAQEFRDRVGLVNKGLITKEVHDLCGSRPQVEKTKEMYSGKGRPEQFNLGSGSSKRRNAKESLEIHKEAIRKAHKEFVSKEKTDCVQCGKAISQSMNGSRKYCSTSCRSKASRNKVLFDDTCCVCGGQTQVTYSQYHSNKSGPYVCSIYCRQKRAGKIARGSWPKAEEEHI